MYSYYVSIKNAGRTGFLLGPFDHFAEASARIMAVKKAAQEVDAFAWFYAFGVSRLERSELGPKGSLNEVFPELLSYTFVSGRYEQQEP